MTKDKSPQSFTDLVNKLNDFVFDDEIEETEDDVNQALINMGYQPDELKRKMRQRLESALEESPLNWRNKQDELENDKDRIGLLKNNVMDLDTSQLISAIKNIMQTAKGHDSKSFAYRNLEAEKTLEEHSREELRDLLAQLKFLEGKEQGKSE